MAYTPFPGDAVISGTAISKAKFGDIVVANLNDHESRLATTESGKVPITRLITAGTGLTGGGDLSADRTLAVAYGATAGTATQGNDTRVVNAVQTSRTITAGTGLTGGGDLSANRTLAANFGTAAGTIAQGNDSRITVTQDGTIGNAALGSRTTALETMVGGTVNSTTAQSFGAGPTRMAFNNAVGTGMPAKTPAGITWTDANDEFTIVTAGVYSVSVSMVFDTAVSATIQFAPTTPSASNTYYISAIGQVNAAGASFTRWFNAGDIIRVYVGTTPATANTIVGYSMFSVYRTR